jgi:hypothetical protein
MPPYPTSSLFSCLKPLTLSTFSEEPQWLVLINTTQEYTTIPMFSKAYPIRVFKWWHTTKARTILQIPNGKPKATDATRTSPPTQPIKLICARNTTIMPNPCKSITFLAQLRVIRNYLITGFLVVKEE